MLNLPISKVINSLSMTKFIGAKTQQIDLFQTVFDGLSPFGFDLLKLALAATLYSNSVKIIRSKKGSSLNGGNPYSGVTTAFLGYLTGRGIPIIIKLSDKICDNIVSTMSKL